MMCKAPLDFLSFKPAFHYFGVVLWSKGYQAKEDDDEVEVSNVINELDTTNMKPEEKVKKKELVDVDHTN